MSAFLWLELHEPLEPWEPLSCTAPDGEVFKNVICILGYMVGQNSISLCDFPNSHAKISTQKKFQGPSPLGSVESTGGFAARFRLITLYGKWLFLEITPFEPLNMVEYGSIFRHLIAIDQGFGIWYNFCSMTLLSDFIGWWSRAKNDKKPSESTKNLVFGHFWSDFTSL